MKKISKSVAGLLALAAVCSSVFMPAQAHAAASTESQAQLTISTSGLYAGINFNLADIVADVPSITANKADVVGQAQPEVQAEVQVNPQDRIYTFSQGPAAWAAGRNWSGEWSHKDISGNTFGSFGCGLTDMASIYDTLSPYEVSPWGMLEYARDHSAYYPTGDQGAIEWGAMQSTLETLGVNSEFYQKNGSYEDFKARIANAQAAIVLVSADSGYWHTKGHYVTAWLYNAEDDTVFLGDPGSFDNNRSRVPLKAVYDAMKTGSAYQSLMINGYNEDANQGKIDGISDNWNRPDYLVR